MRITLAERGIIAFLLVGVFWCTDCICFDRSPNVQKPYTVADFI